MRNTESTWARFRSGFGFLLEEQFLCGKKRDEYRVAKLSEVYELLLRISA